MDFLRKIYGLSGKEQQILRGVFEKAPHENKAYSKLGMKLTFMREDILSHFGLKSAGKSRSASPDVWEDPRRLPRPAVEIPFRELNMKDKIVFFPFRAAAKMIVNWNFFISRIIGGIFPYVKYALPENIDLNSRLTEKNRAYIRRLRERT